MREILAKISQRRNLSCSELSKSRNGFGFFTCLRLFYIFFVHFQPSTQSLHVFLPSLHDDDVSTRCEGLENIFIFFFRVFIPVSRVFFEAKNKYLKFS